ncbi:MAG: nucleotidyltransferase domain-containing protein [candidate division WOR-3 bacterium]
MNTDGVEDRLAQTLFGTTRRAVLGLLYGHADEEFYLRQIVRLTGVGIGPVQREVRALTQSGIILRRVRGHQVFFRANPDCPLFAELRSIVTKTVGVAGALRAALAPLAGQIAVAFIYGSVARGTETRLSDIDVMVIGSVDFADVSDALSPVQERLNREVNVTVYSRREFREKARAGHHFIGAVLKGNKTYVIGDENELNRVASVRLVG